MLRITANLENCQTIRLRLDGTISDDTLNELNRAIAENRNGPTRTVILDMAGVDFMNDHAAHELLKICDDRLRMVNCSPFIITLLDMISETENQR